MFDKKLFQTANVFRTVSIELLKSLKEYIKSYFLLLYAKQNVLSWASNMQGFKVDRNVSVEINSLQEVSLGQSLNAQCLALIQTTATKCAAEVGE